MTNIKEDTYYRSIVNGQVYRVLGFEELYRFREKFVVFEDASPFPKRHFRQEKFFLKEFEYLGDSIIYVPGPSLELVNSSHYGVIEDTTGMVGKHILLYAQNDDGDEEVYVWAVSDLAALVKAIEQGDEE